MQIRTAIAVTAVIAGPFGYWVSALVNHSPEPMPPPVLVAQAPVPPASAACVPSAPAACAPVACAPLPAPPAMEAALTCPAPTKIARAPLPKLAPEPSLKAEFAKVSMHQLVPEESFEGEHGAASRLVSKSLEAAENGDHEKAWGFLKQALKKDPTYPPAHLLAGVLAQIEGDLAQAKTEYGNYVFQAPLGARAPEVRKVIRGMSQHGLNVVAAK